MIKFKNILPVLVLICCIVTNAYALTPFFRAAQTAEKSGDYVTALRLYNQVLEQYPYNIKAKLRAYGRILRVYKTLGSTKKLADTLRDLDAIYPDPYFDRKDLEKLALIYFKHEQYERALKLQYRIIDSPFNNRDRKVILRTYGRLLKGYQQLSNKPQFDELMQRLSNLPVTQFDPVDTYEYAMLFLRYNQLDQGTAILNTLVDQQPYSLAARKSLFVLGRNAQGKKNYNEAIGYYRKYIERYPDQTFFVQKAYQRMVDCHLAKGEWYLSEQTMVLVSEWVNGVADYRSQLNLAVHLFRRQAQPLADVTFEFGLREAVAKIKTQPASYEALKAHLTIVRSAYEFFRFKEAQQSAEAILKDFGSLKGDNKLEHTVRHIKSQAQLWLARIHRIHDRHDQAISLLLNFLKIFPNHKDQEYVFYELGRCYESKGMNKDARKYYALIVSKTALGDTARIQLEGLQ